MIATQAGTPTYLHRMKCRQSDHREQTDSTLSRRTCTHDDRCRGLEWIELLDTEGVQTVILNRRKDRRLLRLLKLSRKWAIDFADRRSVILMRT